jgi:hypothetical protein
MQAADGHSDILQAYSYLWESFFLAMIKESCLASSRMTVVVGNDFR